MVELTVVVPVYRCDECLRPLHQRLREVLGGLVPSYEIVFVDDRSPDDSWVTLLGIAQDDPSVKVLRLSRNFGQHAAITAGLDASSGRWTVVMDCDLQDPPEEIPSLYAKAQEGYDVVVSRRTQRRQSWARRVTGNVYFRVRNVLVRSDMHTNYTNFSMLSRKVVDAFLTLRDKDRQYLLIVHWLGYNRAEIEVDPADRYAGDSSYSLGALIKVAVDGMFFQSTVLLRWIVYTGFVIAAGGMALAAYSLIVLAAGRNLPDWAALSIGALLLSGFIIISTGVTGLYVGKIFQQVKGRPLFVIDTKIVDGVERAAEREVPDSAAAGPGEPFSVGSERERLPS